MKKVDKFIREFHLKYSRKFRHICPEYLGTRFITDSNAKSIAFETEIAHGVFWNLSIVKSHGKYIVTVMHIDNNDIDHEKVWVTSKDSVIEKLISSEIWKADDFSVKNSHMEDLGWRIDKRETIDFGELPNNFKPVEELEPIPEYIDIN